MKISLCGSGEGGPAWLTLAMAMRWKQLGFAHRGAAAARRLLDGPLAREAEELLAALTPGAERRNSM